MHCGGKLHLLPTHLYTTTWCCYLARKKTFWDVKIDLGQQEGKSPYSRYLHSILMFPINIGFVFLHSSSQNWQLGCENWVSLPRESSSWLLPLVTNPGWEINHLRLPVCFFQSELFAATLYQTWHQKEVLKSCSWSVLLFRFSGSLALCFLNIKRVSCWYTYWTS